MILGGFTLCSCLLRLNACLAYVLAGSHRLPLRLVARPGQVPVWEHRLLPSLFVAWLTRVQGDGHWLLLGLVAWTGCIPDWGHWLLRLVAWASCIPVWGETSASPTCGLSWLRLLSEDTDFCFSNVWPDLQPYSSPSKQMLTSPACGLICLHHWGHRPLPPWRGGWHNLVLGSRHWLLWLVVWAGCVPVCGHRLLLLRIMAWPVAILALSADADFLSADADFSGLCFDLSASLSEDTDSWDTNSCLSDLWFDLPESLAVTDFCFSGFWCDLAAFPSEDTDFHFSDLWPDLQPCLPGSLSVDADFSSLWLYLAAFPSDDTDSCLPDLGFDSPSPWWRTLTSLACGLVPHCLVPGSWSALL